MIYIQKSIEKLIFLIIIVQLFAGKSIIEAALTPVSEAQESCVLWLKDHFEFYGNAKPRRNKSMCDDQAYCIWPVQAGKWEVDLDDIYKNKLFELRI